MKLVRAREGETVGRLALADGACRAVSGDDEKRPGVHGVAAPYDSWTTLYEGADFVWRERYAAGCFSGTLERGDDVRSCFNHRLNDILGRRSAGTLTLADTDTGLEYETAINPDDPMAMGVYARVKRGDVAGASCWFRPLKIETVEARVDGRVSYDDTIVTADLFECGPVTDGQYVDATATARAVRDILIARADRSYEDFQAALKAVGG